MTLYKNVNGNRVKLSAEEEAKVRVEWAVNEQAAEAVAWIGNRVAEYPSISDQLDMLWHAMDKDEIPGKGIDWYENIKATKAKYPKPSE